MITLIVIYVSASFIKQYLLLKVIYYFSSQSVSFLLISESITGSITEIINFFSSDDSNYVNIIFLTIDILIILLTSFGTLVYNEIIVIKRIKAIIALMLMYNFLLIISLSSLFRGKKPK